MIGTISGPILPYLPCGHNGSSYYILLLSSTFINNALEELENAYYKESDLSG
jgi:hypothetical protein